MMQAGRLWPALVNSVYVNILNFCTEMAATSVANPNPET